MGKSIFTKEITFKYDESTIIDCLNVSIEKGSFISIIGPNGSGKSTLLKLLAANLVPNRGGVFLEDKNIYSYGKKELAREMAVVPQDTGISFDFDVYDIVLMGRNPHLKRFQRESEEDYKIVRDAMEWTDTWKLRERRINEISGGERQRVIIARALAQEPEIILLDEPTSSLDIHHQIEVLELLKKLNEEKAVTIILVLHDMNLAARYSKEILLLHQGKKVTIGKTEAVMTVENLQKAYHMDMVIERNPYTNTLLIHPLGIKAKQPKSRNIKIHLVCGGGSGKEVVQGLLEEGYQITMGVVNMGDSDWELGEQLSVEMAVERPFSEISEEIFLKAENMANEADVVIMTSIPIGWGNIKNLMLVRRQLEKGKKALLYNQYPRDEKFDYTTGQGIIELKELMKQGLKNSFTKEELFKELEKYEK